MEYGAIFRMYFNLFQTDTGQANGVRAEGGTRGKHAFLVLPPSLGGRTIGDQVSLADSENSQISQI